MDVPETRPSILIRLRDHTDREAWRHFEEVYREVIERIAVRFGMQHADAADLGQDVLIRVSKGIERFDHDPSHAKFRTWLGKVVRGAIVDHHRRRPREQGSGLTEVHDELAQLAAADNDATFRRTLNGECRSEIFRWAARRIRNEFTESSWQAFWQTTVQQRSVDAVAKELEKSPGAVYTSRSRIMRRLREEVCLFDDQPITESSSMLTEAASDEL